MIVSTLFWRDNISSFIDGFIMPKIVDHTGKKFGRLTVLGLAGKSGNDRKCRVRCDCGTEKEVVQSRLTTTYKPTRSCGCLAKENHFKTHGLTKHKWYPVWKAMISRCEKPESKSYKDYGGRGISVCQEWKESLQSFFDWLESNGYEKGLEIDRENNDGNYCPENCRVVAKKLNLNNRRDTEKFNIDGEMLTIAQMSEKYDIKYATLYKRIKILKIGLNEALSMKPWQRVGPVRS